MHAYKLLEDIREVNNKMDGISYWLRQESVAYLPAHKHKIEIEAAQLEAQFKELQLQLKTLINI